MSSIAWTAHLDEGNEREGDTEQALVESAKHDPAALSELYRRHYSVIARYVIRRVGDQHEAEDIISNVFLGMVKNLGRYQSRGIPFRFWLYRLANTQLSRWARTNRRTALQQLDEQAAACSDDTSAKADAETVDFVLSSLPSRLQTALSLHYLEGMKVADIAIVMDCPPGTVKSRLSEGRALMKTRLKRKGY